jgi:putative ATP-dependent endonuclease of OLD family
MARVRKVEIGNFRAIRSLEWFPGSGINCLIGPGDSGKSTILDAIDLCLGARRTLSFCDDDFHRLDTNQTIRIAVTLGELDANLRSLDRYGLFLRGFDRQTGQFEDEPSRDLETVLTLELTVATDLEPQWRLVSDRAEAQESTRSLAWADRVRLAPTRIGQSGDHNLSWRRGSVLNRVSDERANASAVIAQAARDARKAFGDGAREQLSQALSATKQTADRLGVPVGAEVQALLDAHSVSFNGGTISLHDQTGVPLRGLGLGSVRLLVAGLQRHVAGDAPMILIDELEHGLEPHRVIRLLGELGAKEATPTMQAFASTHSPVAVRELAASQLFVVREVGERHHVYWLGSAGDVQGTIRTFPDALLAKSVLVCEGASEVGLTRGIDLSRQAANLPSLMALGTALVDGGGDRCFERARQFQAMGYRTALLRDSDIVVHAEVEAAFRAAGGSVFSWTPGNALEDELFGSLDPASLVRMIDLAIELREEGTVDAHIRTASGNLCDLATVRGVATFGVASIEDRALLGRASRLSRGWYKNVTAMEIVGRDIVGPAFNLATPAFQSTINSIVHWCAGA